MFVRAQEVVIGSPKGKVIVRPVKAVKAVCRAVGCLISAVQPFDHLLVRTELRRDGVIVCQADDLSNLKFKTIAVFIVKLLCGKRVCTVPVGNKPEVFRQLF